MDLAKKNYHRFIIHGAGAIGSTFGGMLARAGHQVQLVGRDAHMRAVREGGLVMDGLLGDHVVKGIGTFTGLSGVSPEPPVKAVFISVKSSDTGMAVADLKQSRLVGGQTLVVSLQNGLGNLEQIRQAYGPERSIGGRVIFGAQVTRPGHVHVSVWADSVLLGGPSSREGKRACHDLADLLTACGIETKPVDHIEAALWGKVLYNVGLNPLSALLNVSYGALGKEAHARGLLVQLMEEAFAVASAETELPWGTVGEYIEHFFARLLPPTESHLSSMLQDMERGRATEIDAITGEVIRRAELLNLPVPVNRVIYELIKAREGVDRK